MNAWKVLFVAFLTSVFYGVFLYGSSYSAQSPSFGEDASSITSVTSAFTIVGLMKNYFSSYWGAIKDAPFPINIITAILFGIQTFSLGYLMFRVMMAILGRMVL